jgi:beta-1,4-mannosyltransferase
MTDEQVYTMTPKSLRQDAARVQIAMYPYAENPYQTLLVHALEERDCNIVKVQYNYDRFPVRLLAQFRNAGVVHFHWIDHLYYARTRLVAMLRTAFFLAMLLVLRNRGTRIIYTLHNLVPHDTRRPRFHRIVQRLIIKLADATIVHSQPALNVAKETYGQPGKFHIIPHGRCEGFYPDEVSRSQARAQLKIPGDAKAALFLGVMLKYKGVQALLESAEELGRRNILLVLAGDSSNLEKSARDLLIRQSQKNVLLYEGFVPPSQIQYYMRAADCLVLPYLESFTSGMAFLGLSFRLPIVATNATAFNEMIKLGLCLPCDPDDPNDVAETIERVCAWDRATFEERCSSFLETCAWDRIADKHIALYGLYPDGTDVLKERQAHQENYGS